MAGQTEMGHWKPGEQPSISTQANLTVLHPPVQGSLDCLPCDPVREHDFYRQEMEVVRTPA